MAPRRALEGARVGLLTLGTRGDVAPLIALAKELNQLRGTECFICSTDAHRCAVPVRTHSY